MRRRRSVTVLLVALLALAGCTGTGADDPDGEPAGDATGLPNPASVHCEEQGGTVELREEPDGSTTGYCLFDDGSECEEWAFQRGECAPGDGDTAPATVTVQVYFANAERGDPCGEVFPVDRTVPAADPVAGAVAALLAGPSQAERDEGYEGWFGPDTAAAVRSVTVEGTTAEVDFTDLRAIIPNASTSCGSAGLLAQLDSTLLQFPEIEQARYRIEGSDTAFYEWLQMGVPSSE